MFEDSRTKVFVCNVTNANAANYTALPAQSGAFYVVTTGASVYDDTTVIGTSTMVFAHRNTRGVLELTVPFVVGEIHNATGSPTLPRVEQVTYLGYNGTSGSMDAANSTYYGLGIVLNHTFGLLNNSPLMVTIPFKSDSTATQSEVSAGLAIAATKWLSRQAFKPFTVERINSGAQLSSLGALTITSAAAGSNVVVFSATCAANVGVGTILRLGTRGAGVTPCYVVTAIDGTGCIVTLDQPVQAAALTYANSVIETVTEGNWGLKFTGTSVADADFNPITDEPFVVSFELRAGDFTTATVTNTTAPFIGNGTYQIVSALEAKSQFESKRAYVSAYPPTVYSTDAISGDTYDIITFEVWKQTFVDATTGVSPISKVRYIIAILDGLVDATDPMDHIVGVTADA